MTKNAPISAGEQPVRFEEITPEAVDYYVRYGNHLRAATMAAYAAGLGRWLACLWDGARAPREPVDTVADRFANGLAAIRCSAEILRDTPDLDAVERARFVAIVLEEERRLARALAATPSLAAQPVASH